jgi:O-antigen ligase
MLAALIVLLAVTVTATRSRAGFALLMISVIASAAVWLRAGRQGAWAEARPWLRAVALISGVITVQYTLYGLLLRLETDPMDDLRWSIAANTLQAAEPARGIGFGLGTFVHAYDEIGDASAELSSYVNHAHDDFAELWLEGGFPAAALMVAGIVMVGWQLRKYLLATQAEDGDETQHRGLKLGAAFSLLLLILHSLVDYPLRTLALASYAGLLAGVLLGSVRRHGIRTQS